MASGPTVDISARIEPGASPSANPSGPSATSCRASGVESTVMATSAPAAASAVGRVGGHGVEGVAAEHDPRLERNGFAGRALRIPVAVPPLVRGPDDRDDRLEERDRFEDLGADDRVAFHQPTLPRGERTGLADD